MATKGILAAGAALTAMFSTLSYATVISSSDPYNFSWNYSSAAGALTGTGSLSVSGFGTGTLTVDVSLSNTSALGSNRLTAFGFGIDPNATGVTFSDASDGGMINASMASMPSLATIEICAWGGQNCPGGGNGGIFGGDSDSFSLLLSGTWGSSVNIAPIGFKYQTGVGSFEFTTTDTPPPTRVPEPATLSLLGLGMLGFTYIVRRRRGESS